MKIFRQQRLLIACAVVIGASWPPALHPFGKGGFSRLFGKGAKTTFSNLGEVATKELGAAEKAVLKDLDDIVGKAGKDSDLGKMIRAAVDTPGFVKNLTKNIEKNAAGIIDDPKVFNAILKSDVALAVVSKDLPANVLKGGFSALNDLAVRELKSLDIIGKPSFFARVGSEFTTAYKTDLKGAGWLFISPQHLVGSLVFGVGAFSVPAWIEQALSAKHQREALAGTVEAPQYFGGAWVMIPHELVNQMEPGSSIPLYMGIPNELINPEVLKGLKAGGRPAGHIDLTKADYFIPIDDWGIGRHLMTETPSGKMLHVNTGLIMFGDGSAANTKVPAMQLLGDGNTLVQTLREFAGRVESGSPIKKTAASNLIDSIAWNGVKAEKAKGSKELANVLRTANENVPPLILMPTMEALKKPFGNGQIVVQPVSSIPAEPLKRIANRVTTPAPDVVFEAYNTFVYQRVDTPAVLSVRQALAQDKSRADLAAYVVDYVVALDAFMNLIPARAPVVARVEGQSVFPRYAWNPQVAFFYSLVDDSLVSIDGRAAAFDESSKAQVVNALRNMPRYAVLDGQIAAMRSFMAEIRSQGPFTVGSIDLVIPQELMADKSLQERIPVYAALTSEKNPGVLEGARERGYADYLVAVDERNQLVRLPSSKVKYFISLVSSRYYAADMTLLPDADQVRFYVMSCADEAGNKKVYFVPEQSHTRWQEAKCTDLFGPESAPRSTVYMDWQLNPFNKPEGLIAFDQKLRTALLAGLAAALPSLSENQRKNGAGAIAVWISQLMDGAGISLDQLQAKKADADAIAKACADAVAAALANKPVTDPRSMIAELKKQPTLFAQLGTAIAASLAQDQALIAQFNQLSSLVPTTDLAANRSAFEAVRLAKMRKIPLAGQYMFDVAELFQGESASSVISKSAAPLARRIVDAFVQWKSYMLENVADWSLFEAAQPFSFTSKLLENVVIQATSTDDIRKGAYVYTSLQYPGEYFIVSNKPELKEFGAVPFDIFSPQQYLVSLSSGVMYRRDSDDTLRVAQNFAALDVLNTVAARAGNTMSAALRQEIEKSQKAISQERVKEYFYTYAVLADEKSGLNGNAFVYLDVTSVSDAKDQQILAKVPDIFVAARYSDGSLTDVGLQLTGETDVLVSLVSGAIYGRNGYRGSVRLDDNDPQAPFKALSDMVKGILRDEVRAAVRRLISSSYTQYLEGKKKQQIAAKTEQPLLDSNITRSLKDGEFLKLPYQGLKKVGPKYYGVNIISGIAMAVDYAATADQGLLYDLETRKVQANYVGSLLDIQRRRVGVVVDEKGGQKLGMPNPYVSLPLKMADGSDAMVIASQVAPGAIDAKVIAGVSYTFYFNRILGTFLAKAKQAQDEYYLDLVSGYTFNLNGSIRIPAHIVALGQTTQKPLFIDVDTNKVMRIHFAYDGAKYRSYMMVKNISTQEGDGILFRNQEADHTIILYTKGDAAAPTYSLFQDTGFVEGEDRTYTQVDTYLKTGSCERVVYVRTAPNNGWEFLGEKSSFVPQDQADLLIMRDDKGAVSAALYRATPDTNDFLVFSAKKADNGTYILEAKIADQQLGTAKKAYISWEFADALVDQGTQARYAAIRSKEAGKTYYFGYVIAPMALSELRDLQTQLGFYPIINAAGVLSQVRSFNPSSLKVVDIVADVPDAYKTVADDTAKSGKFLYDPVSKRYFYQLGFADTSKSYYREGAAYVDLANGGLFTDAGIPFFIADVPLGVSLSAVELLTLQREKHVAVPLDADDKPMVNQKGQPYLLWRF